MEQFTRECLEVDKQADEEKPETRLVGSTSMEQIYVRAARLVKRTLDVEDAIIMDVSHVDVLETVGAESSTSLTLHHADPALESTSRSGMGPRLHLHPYAETFVIRRGSATFTIAGDTLEAHAGQILVVPAHTPHAFSTGPHGYEALHIHASPEFDTTWLE